MNISDKQLAANRRNAQLSTGPLSPEGKRRSSGNSLKHAIFQKALFLNSDDLEELKEFNLVLYGLVQEWKPEGQTEALILQKIATDYVRLRRVLQYETAIIQNKLEPFSSSSGSSLIESLEKINRMVTVLRNFDNDPVAAANCFLEQTNSSDGKTSSYKEYWTKKLDDYKSVCSKEKAVLRTMVFEFADHMNLEMIEKRKSYEKLNRLACENSFLSEKQVSKVTKYESSLERLISRNLEKLIVLQKRRGKENTS
jgi:hypothetical protein